MMGFQARRVSLAYPVNPAKDRLDLEVLRVIKVPRAHLALTNHRRRRAFLALVDPRDFVVKRASLDCLVLKAALDRVDRLAQSVTRVREDEMVSQVPW